VGLINIHGIVAVWVRGNALVVINVVALCQANTRMRNHLIGGQPSR